MEIDCTEDNDSVILVSGEEHRQEGTNHYKKGDYVAALQCYTAAIDTEPNVPSYYNNRSAVYIMMKKYDLALEDAKKCVELESDNPKYLNRLGKCELIHGNWNLAENLYNKALSIDESNTEAQNQLQTLENCRSHYSNYQVQTDKCDYRHALFCLERCIDISPESEEMNYQRISLFIKLKRYTDAKSILESLIQLKSDSHSKTEALFYRGLIFYYMDHSDKASEHFQHVLRQNPDHIQAQRAFKRIKNLNKLKEDGNHFVKSRQFEKARDSYSKALEIDPDNDIFNAKLYCNRALTLMKTDKTDEALSDCNKAINLDNSYEKPKFRRISILMQIEKWDDAIKEAEILEKSNSSSELTALLKEAKRGKKRSSQMNPYKTLGVTRHASEQEIKKAYKKKSLMHHPDRHPNADDETKKVHEIKFKELNAAYSVLSDAKKKSMYDNGADIEDVLGNTGGGCNGSSFSPDQAAEMFQFFHGRGRGGCGGGNSFTYSFG